MRLEQKGASWQNERTLGLEQNISVRFCLETKRTKKFKAKFCSVENIRKQFSSEIQAASLQDFS